MSAFPAVLFLFAFFCWSKTSTADPVTHYYNFNVAHMTGAPDGFSRPMLGINGQSPGPAIIVNAGDRIVAKVKNVDIQTGTAMHWHGIRHTLSNNMDGVVHVTQNVIAMGETFVYDFFVDGPGTFWYHAHFKTQYMAGVRASLIVLDPSEKMYTDRILMLADWYHEDETQLTKTAYLVPASDGVEPVPYSALIHGVGQNSTCLSSKTCRYAVTAATTFSGDCGRYETYEQLLAAQAKRVVGLKTVPDAYKITRMKLIGSAGFAAFNFSIDGHALWILKLDGQPVVPQKVSDLLINAGQRVDLAVCRIRRTGPSAVWIRSEMNQDVFGYGSDTSGALAILTYTNMYAAYKSTSDPITGSSGNHSLSIIKAEPTTLLPSGSLINGFQSGKPDPFGFEGGESGSLGFRADVDALPGLYPPPDATRIIPIRIDFNTNEQSVNVGHFNNISMVMDASMFPIPLLQRVAEGQSIEGQGMNIVKFDSSEVIELVIDNYDSGEHPIHVHGRRMYVMARGQENSGPYNEIAYPMNIADPILRDTITVAANSSIVIRFAESNPGLWMMHCHINWHQAAGLAMVFQETVAEPVVEEEEPICLYCVNSYAVKVGVSSSIIGLVFLLSIGYCMWSRNQRNKSRSSHTEDEEGKEEAKINNLVGIPGNSIEVSSVSTV